MAKLYLGYADDPRFNNSNGINGAFVDAASVTAAKAAIKAATVSGETLNTDNWTFLEYAATAGTDFPAGGVVFVEGRVIVGNVQRRGQ